MTQFSLKTLDTIKGPWLAELRPDKSHLYFQATRRVPFPHLFLGFERKDSFKNKGSSKQILCVQVYLFKESIK